MNGSCLDLLQWDTSGNKTCMWVNNGNAGGEAQTSRSMRMQTKTGRERKTRRWQNDGVPVASEELLLCTVILHLMKYNASQSQEDRMRLTQKSIDCFELTNSVALRDVSLGSAYWSAGSLWFTLSQKMSMGSLSVLFRLSWCLESVFCLLWQSPPSHWYFCFGPNNLSICWLDF